MWDKNEKGYNIHIKPSTEVDIVHELSPSSLIPRAGLQRLHIDYRKYDVKNDKAYDVKTLSNERNISEKAREQAGIKHVDCA